MRIGLFGLGYVGAVSAGLLARRGHSVTGVDINPIKVDAINRGQSPVEEAGLSEAVAAAHRMGLLRASQQVADGVLAMDLILVCVGTPSRSNGRLNLETLERVVKTIGELLGERSPESKAPTIAIRSTVEPGTMARLRAMLESDGLECGRDLHLVFNPEFLREGSAVRDFDFPPYTIVGSDDPIAPGRLEELYAGIEAPFIVVPMRVAELVKMVNNALHALKVAFANEIGTLAKSVEIDGRQLMDLVCQDTKLNVSTAYLRPGFAYGGSCLPKDLRSLNAMGSQLDLQLPVLQSIAQSNDEHIERVCAWLKANGRKPLGLVGLAFKQGTDDLRESPLVRIAEWAVGKGYPLAIYDPWVRPSKLTGSNREYVERHVPHLLERLHESLSSLVQASELLVVGAGRLSTAEQEALAGFRGPLLDLMGHDALLRDSSGASYEGICW
jgi:GDP-mannose 6-dehydrogenase